MADDDDDDRADDDPARRAKEREELANIVTGLIVTAGVFLASPLIAAVWWRAFCWACRTL